MSLGANATEQEILKELHTVALVKESAIEEYLSNSKHAAEGLARLDAIQNFAQETSLEDQSLYHQAAFDAMHSFQEANWGAFHHMYITDKNGKVVLSPPHGTSTSSHYGQDISHSPFFAAAFDETQITDFFGFEEI